MSNRIDGKDFMIGALIGGLLGAATALLLAPKPGRELRSDLCDQYGKISEKTVEYAGVVGQKAQEIGKEVGGKTSELAVKTKEKAIEGVNYVKSLREGRKEIAVNVEETATVSDEQPAEAVAAAKE